jgi:methyltransferase-like protein
VSKAAADRLGEAWARSPRMVGRRIGEEYVLVPLADRGADLDSILNLNRVAAFVWEQLDGQRNGSDVVASVLERFEVERARAEQDYLELIEALLEVGAVSSARRRGPA